MKQRFPKLLVCVTGALLAIPLSSWAQHEVPYFENFLTPETLNEYTILDVNADGSTWMYGQDQDDHDVRYRYSNENAGDDWLITPAIKLEAGKTYQFSLSARSMSESMTERFEVKMGAGNTVEAMTKQVIEGTDVRNTAYKSFASNVTVDADGEYNFGIHAISNADLWELHIDSVSVTIAQEVSNAYEVPYFENFLAPETLNEYTILDVNADGSTWMYGQDQDDHDVRYRYSNENAGDDWLITPAIKLEAGKTYQFSLSARSMSESMTERFEVKMGAGNTVEAMTKQVIEGTDVRNTAYKSFAGNVTVDADGEYNFGIHAISNAELWELHIDSVSVTIAPEQVDVYDVAVSLNAPANMSKGQTENIKVNINNIGSVTASNVTLVVTANNVEVYKQQVEDIAAGNNIDITVPYTVEHSFTGESVELKAEALFESDADNSNNTATATIAIESLPVNPPTNLNGVQNEDVSVTLTWTAPEGISGYVTETFDTYAPWAIQFGDWTLIDGLPGASTGSIFTDYEYGSQGTPFAFTIMNPSEINPDFLDLYSEMTPHSGNQYAMAVFKVEDSSWPDNDEWMISPKLPGTEQIISLYAMNITGFAETFDILYSTTGNNIEDFTKIGNTNTVNSGAWTKYIADLPEGAVYFAIHRNTKSATAYALCIDDISYKTGNVKASGYNIYIDGELAGTVNDGNTVTYTTAPQSNGEHTYSVTALYGNGSESEPVSITLTTTSIDEIFGEGSRAYDIYTVDGVLVRKQATNADGLKKGIYVINNKAVVIK